MNYSTIAIKKYWQIKLTLN